MLRLSIADAAVAMDSTNTTGPGVVPFDGLLDYWPLPGQSKDGGPRAARLLVGVGSEVVAAQCLCRRGGVCEWEGGECVCGGMVCAFMYIHIGGAPTDRSPA